jgi:glycosyltransferase involved in cell wall biosynthesis
MQHKILFCRETLWDDINKLSTYYYAEQFALNGWSTFWLSRPLNPGSFLSSRWMDAKKRKLALWRSGGKSPIPNVFCYTPFTLIPYRNLWWLGTKWVATNSLKFTFPPLVRIFRRYDFETPDILWFSDLAQAAILDIVRPKCVVFHVTDDYSQFPTAPKSVSTVEHYVASRSDVIFITHPDLQGKFNALRKPVHFLPHGIDAQRFLKRHPLPSEYRSIPQPRVIYLGAIAEWMEWDILYELANRCLTFSFVFIGSMTATSQIARKKWSAIVELPNVYWLGPKNRDQVPAYLQHANIGIIPFSVGGLKQYSNPMKLYEYLASGLPVITTWPVWERLHIETALPMVTACTTQDFEKALKELIDQYDHNSDYEQAGRVFAEKHSWQRRFSEAMEQIAPYLEHK